MIGGTPDTQKELLATLVSDAAKRPQDRNKRKPVIANEFALGYTYQDVLDADQEGENHEIHEIHGRPEQEMYG